MGRLIGIAFFTIIAVVFSAAVSFAEPAAVGIKLDGADIITDTPPVIENGRTLAPVRAIFEAMGGTAAWDEAAGEVVLSGRGTDIKLAVGSTDAYINGTLKTLDVPARIINGRTMMPLRFVSEAMGCEVSWDEQSKTVNIVSPTDEEDLAIISAFRFPEGDKVSQRRQEISVI